MYMCCYVFHLSTQPPTSCNVCRDNPWTHIFLLHHVHAIAFCSLPLSAAKTTQFHVDYAKYIPTHLASPAHAHQMTKLCGRALEYVILYDLNLRVLPRRVSAYIIRHCTARVFVFVRYIWVCMRDSKCMRPTLHAQLYHSLRWFQ